MAAPDLMEKLVSLAKRRGFVYQSSEIYGGLAGFFDFGPVGVALRKNIKDFWWKRVTEERMDVVGVDTSIIAHPQTWVASGHVSSFSDPMVDCMKCKQRFRADHLPAGTIQCPSCKGELTEPRQFNLMFQTHIGAMQDSTSVAYLRPETCQSIFTEFKNVQAASRLKPPFGIAQIGKSFRNEITPRNFIFRSREFEQMELEFFVYPEEGEMQRWYETWQRERLQWFYDLGIRRDKLRIRPHAPDELAHYAKGCVDIEYELPMGWSEIEGIANRSNYDLTQHMTVSGKDLQFFDQEKNEKYTPAVIECSVGVDRTFLTVLADSYCEEDVKGETRVVLKMAPHIAPVKAAVLPLSKQLAEPCLAIARDLRKRFVCDYDDAGSIGKRYRRQDEIGTPLCITYDFESQTDQKVTVRHRDSMTQDRIAIDHIDRYLNDQILLKT